MVVANDITHMIGSFAPPEDVLFKVRPETLFKEIFVSVQSIDNSC